MIVRQFWFIVYSSIFMEVMDVDKLEACMEEEKAWRCPIESCRKVLSRKQTLQTHLLCIHDVKAGEPTKRYKLYEHGESLPVPYSTAFRKRKEEIQEQSENTDNQMISIPDDIVYHDYGTEEITSNETDDVFEYELEELIQSSSSEDEDEVVAGAENLMNEPPLYIMPPSNNLYESDITKSEHTMSVSAFAVRHNLSDCALKDLLRLLQLHLPQNNIGETSVPQLKAKCGFDKNYITCKLYCDSCKKVYTDAVNVCQTPGCVGVKSDSDSCKYFVTSDLKLQIKEILERKGMWEAIQMSKVPRDTDTITDVTSAFAYKQLQKDGKFLDKSLNITLSMFTDGVPLFKSSGISIWPVYFLINEIPGKERFLRKNMLLWGLWQGHGKPKMNMFLHPLVLDLLELYNKGVSITVENRTFDVKAMVVVITMDLQARAFVTNMTHHNGENACLYCNEPGIRVESGGGTCRSFPEREIPASLRNEEDFQNDAVRAHESGTRVHGIFGISILSYLPYLSLTSSVVVDYMHGTLLGVTKKLLHLWFDQENKTQPFYIGDKITVIDRNLKKIKPPYSIHRMPRIIANTFMHWKASELRNWLLFYSLPCLHDRLPLLYFQHFSCLVESTYILLGQGITPADLIRADSLYKFFVAQAANLYGENILGLNFHNLTHTVDCVKRWGPLWAWSCFAYESFNGEIKQGVHGTGNVCRQIFWAFQAQKRLVQTLYNSYSLREGDFKNFVEDMLVGTDKKVGQDAYQCKVVKPSTVVKKFDEKVISQLQNFVNFDSELDFLTVSKIIRNGFFMYCSSCSKTKRQNSYTVALETKTSTGEVAIEVEKYLLHKDTRLVFAVGKMMVSTGRMVPHLQILEERGQFSVVPAQSLREPLFVVQKDNLIYAALFPNTFERD